MAEEQKNKSFLMILAALSVAIVVVLALYLGLQKGTLAQEQERLAQEIDGLNAEIQNLESQKVEAAQFAQKWLEILEQDEVRWSRVLSQVQSLVPYDAATNRNKINFLSYSGSQGGRVSMNATTRELRNEPFDDVAELIEVFNESSFFSNAYVPSITRVETDTGARVATFIFNALYKDIGLEAIGEGAATVDAAAAPSAAGEDAAAPASDQPGVSRQ